MRVPPDILPPDNVPPEIVPPEIVAPLMAPEQSKLPLELVMVQPVEADPPPIRISPVEVLPILTAPEPLASMLMAWLAPLATTELVVMPLVKVLVEAENVLAWFR